MAQRKFSFVNGRYYHVFNRGVDKRIVYTDAEELYFFFHRLHDLNSTDSTVASKDKRKIHKDKATLDEGKKLVSMVAYCLLPNHFHLLLKQNVDDGVSQFMQRLGTSYVKFFNKKHDRSGSLFQGKFKATQVDGDYAVPIVASYVNLNFKHHAIDPAKHLVKSSMFEYLNTELGDAICERAEIDRVISESGGLARYKKLAKNASMVFASNKNVTLSAADFEF